MILNFLEVLNSQTCLTWDKIIKNKLIEMNLNTEKISELFSRDGEREMYYDYTISYFDDTIDETNIKFNTLKNLGFITTYKKKNVLDLDKILKFDSELFDMVFRDILEKFIYIESDVINNMSGEDIMGKYENETEDDFLKETENLNVHDYNKDLLHSSLYAKTLEKFGIIKVKVKKVEITEKIKTFANNYEPFIRNSLVMIEDNGEEYNPVIFEYLKKENILVD